jgi:oxygen-independent coproporphyrinogen-3 oxidase
MEANDLQANIGLPALIQVNAKRIQSREPVNMLDNADTSCPLKPDCPRDPSWALRLVEKHDTRVPRYTSYPTAAQFGANVGATRHLQWLANLDAARPVSLYIHIPFCERLCWYCGCNTGVAHKRSRIVDYIETLKKEIALIAAVIPHRLEVAALHLGGGSPNTLSPGDLDGLFACLKESFAIDASTAIAAEIDPRSLTQEWVDAAACIGLSRASLGVQDLDPAVQKAINRHQPYAMVEWAVRALRAASVRSINLDLVYGLPRQTTPGLLSTVDQVLDLEPDRLALFGYAHVPWMMARQKLIDERELPDAGERYRQQLAAADRIEDAGYLRIGLDHFAMPTDSLAIAARNGTLQRDFQGYTSDRHTALIGLGASSISSFTQGYVQNYSDTKQWREMIEAGRLATGRGVELSNEDRFWGEIIERLMCDLNVDLAYSCQKWGICSAWLVPEIARLRVMERDGLVRIRGSLVTVTELGRPFLRAICAVFDQYLTDQDTAPRHSRMI